MNRSRDDVGIGVCGCLALVSILFVACQTLPEPGSPSAGTADPQPDDEAGLEWRLVRACGDLASLGRNRGTSLNGVAWGGGRVVAVGVDGKIVQSSDGGRWEEASDSATSRTLRAVAWSGERFVAVGDRSTIVHSVDGDCWEAATDSGVFRRPLRVVDLFGVTWNGERLVAVGTGGTIVHSGDGDRWEEASESGTSAGLRGVAWSGERFVAVGGGTIVHSTDGDRWTEAGAGATTDFLQGVSWGDGRLVAVGRRAAELGRSASYGSGDVAIVYSVDGDQWEEASAAGTPDFLRGVAWGGGRFVAVGGGAIVHSVDGDRWEEASAASTDGRLLNAVAYGGERFVAVGDGGAVATSP